MAVKVLMAFLILSARPATSEVSISMPDVQAPSPTPKLAPSPTPKLASHAPGWYKSGIDESCTYGCATVGLRCSEINLYARNSDVDTSGKLAALLRSVKAGSASSCYGNYGTKPDVPGFQPSVCFFSSPSRSFTSFNCNTKPSPRGHQKQRLCYCSAPTPVDSCLVVDVNYAGNDLRRSFATSSPSTCQAACVAEERCKFFTWVNNACYLKSSSAGAKPRKRFISGPRVCQAPPCTPTSCPLGLTCKSDKKCCKSGDWGCCGAGSQKFTNRLYCPFGWITCNNGWCEDTESKCPDGVRFSATACKALRYYEAPQNGQNCEVPVTSSAECAQAAVDLQLSYGGEISYEWNRPTGCFNDFAGSSVFFNTKSTGGGRGCCDRAICKAGCFVPDVNYDGNDIRHMWSSSPSTCQAACVAEERCKFFTWYEDVCYLKYSTLGIKPYAGATSGPRVCQAPTPAPTPAHPVKCPLGYTNNPKFSDTTCSVPGCDVSNPSSPDTATCCAPHGPPTQKCTLVLKTNGDATFGYSSPFWTNTDLLNEHADHSLVDNAKYQGFNDQSFKTITMCAETATPTRDQCVEIDLDKTWDSARVLFSSGYMRDDNLDQHGILRMFGLLSPMKQGSYADCGMLKPGFNTECRHGYKARIGYGARCANQPCRTYRSGDIDNADAIIGIGLAAGWRDTDEEIPYEMGAGWTNYFASGAGTCAANSKTTKNVWLFVGKCLPPVPAPASSSIGTILGVVVVMFCVCSGVGYGLYRVAMKQQNTQKFVPVIPGSTSTSSDPLLKGMEKNWADLTSAERSAAQLCGWTRLRWDSGLNSRIDLLTWSQVTSNQRDALKTLGYTEKLWNEKVTANPNFTPTLKTSPVNSNLPPYTPPPSGTMFTPATWTHNDLSQRFDARVEINRPTRLAIEKLVKETFTATNSVQTSEVIIIRIQRIEDARLWVNYQNARQGIKRNRAQIKNIESIKRGWLGGGSKVKTEIEDIVHVLDNPKQIDPDLNEFYLWHGGATMENVTGFDGHYMEFSRSETYEGGSGVDLTECYAKADETALEGSGISEGVHALLLCRATCGQIYRPPLDPRDDTCQLNLASGEYDSLMYESSGTGAREFVVLNKDQVYPEFVVLYQRLQ